MEVGLLYSYRMIFIYISEMRMADVKTQRMESFLGFRANAVAPIYGITFIREVLGLVLGDGATHAIISTKSYI